ncbi:General substrate transporter [Mycena indigotica]|uniref:General substrate transporter n=1 Tax=Mycena indigotica TaxID=2126181 RepID=A0A8H6SL59_9AGAR|nr:General substrate transporter [Mycena indigotica]KAF7301013.1 General substrate transporter [Mycena indigotica]
MPGGAVVFGTADTSRIEAPVTFKTYFMCVFAAFGGIFFGYDTGWMGGVLGMPYFIQMYTHKPYPADPRAAHIPSDFALPAWEKSLMTSILSAGTFFGALIAGDVADTIGRRPTIVIGCVVFAVGCILEIAPKDALACFAIGRVIAGAGVGFISAIIILYMSEIAPKKVRGALVSGYQFCITIGILLANCVVYATQDRLDTGSYRIPIGVQFLWAIILGGGLLFLPESPRYWAKKGDIERATDCLARVRDQPRDSDYVQDELAEIIANLEFEKEHIPATGYVGSWLACFKGSIWDGSSNIRRTIVGTGLQCAQQFTGINFIFYFGTSFFQTLGTISNPFLISLVTTLVNVLSTPFSFYIIEKFGRRRILLIGGSFMVICQYIVAIIGTAAPHAQTPGGNPAAVRAEIAFICLNIASFAMTWGPAAWVVVGEMFPLPIRSRGVGMSTASNWFWNCIIGVITPYFVSTDEANLGPKVFFIWASTCALSVTFAYFTVSETKGLSLEQVDQMLNETTPRTSSSWRPHTTWAAEKGKVGAAEEKLEDKESA